MKKYFYWMIFVFIAVIFGCAHIDVTRADLPKTFPGAQILKEKLDSEEALKILYKYNKLDGRYHIGFTGNFQDLTGPFEWKSDGLHYNEVHFVSSSKEYISKTEVRITSIKQRIPMVMNFQDIQRLWISRAHKGELGWRNMHYIYVTFKERQIALTVFLEEERDQVIAALLTLCPNIK